jgi:integrase
MVYKRKNHWHLDVTVDEVRYREALNTTDRREALAKEKDRIAEIKAGKVAAPAGRAFSRLTFIEAAKAYQQDREGKVAERTTQFEAERLKPLQRHFGDKILRTIKAQDVVAYQKARMKERVSGRTVNMETGVLRRMLKNAKLFAVLADFPKPFPEHEDEIGKVLTAEAKRHLFKVAASKPPWMVAHCAAVLAASTTCRKVELRHIRWRTLDFFSRTITIHRSKTAAGHREIPMNDDALAALARLKRRSEADGFGAPDHFVFPTCEYGRLDGSKPQKTWRTAWRSLVKEAVRQANEEDDKEIAAALKGFRFHDLRHQAITELAEAGAPDRVIESLAGHLSRKMLDHYSHVRRAAKRDAISKLPGGLMPPQPASMPVSSTAVTSQPASQSPEAIRKI